MSAGISDISTDIRNCSYKVTKFVHFVVRCAKDFEVSWFHWWSAWWCLQVAGGVDSSLYPVAVLIDELRFGPQQTRTDNETMASTKVHTRTIPIIPSLKLSRTSNISWWNLTIVLDWPVKILKWLLVIPQRKDKKSNQSVRILRSSKLSSSAEFSRVQPSSASL